MMAIVKNTRELKIDNISNKIIIFYSELDNTVDPKQTKAIFNRLEHAQKNMIEIKNPGDNDNHVLAGDALSPNTTKIVLDAIEDFIKA